MHLGSEKQQDKVLSKHRIYFRSKSALTVLQKNTRKFVTTVVLSELRPARRTGFFSQTHVA